MPVEIKRGDLLGQDVDAIVNTVNCVGIMGKGIALQFKQKWPENFKAYESACVRHAVRIGEMFIYDAGGLVKPNFIINFPTKNHWREKSRLEYIDKGLEDLTRQICRLNIKSIAIPPLGCGNGGLEWAPVKALITKALQLLPDVEVRLFEPGGAPPPREMVNRTARPRMTPARAAIVKLISIYRAVQYALSKIEVQKLVYFLEEAGQALNLEFEKHKYGPYSNKLRHVLKAMDGHYISGVGDHSGESEIIVLPEALVDAERFLEEESAIGVRNQIAKIEDLIDGFETPYGMELLATVHWVASREYADSVSAAIRAVHAWNDRKKTILRPEHIEIAWKRLADQGWLNAAER